MLEEILGDTHEGRELITRLLDPATFEQALAGAPFSPTMKLTLNAQLRNTATPTILSAAGSRINVIPSTAEASLDGRPLPDATAEEFVRELREIVGDEIEIDVYEYWPGASSSFDTELFRIMKQVTGEVTGGAGLVPFMATGASDARFAEPLGVHVYGFGPMRDEPGAAPSALMHAHDERISLSNIELGLRILHETVLRIAT
jgi:acetylornithine deacetylase/succinyl-diaminopimelate desuccinylase-like protein